MKVAFITGALGQDGVLISELLKNKGYRVVGFIREKPGRYSIANSYFENFSSFFEGDVLNYEDVEAALKSYEPDEIYHLAAQTHVLESFRNPAYTLQVNVLGTENLLRAVRSLNLNSKIFFASSAEIFGSPEKAPQNEQTPFNPLSPFAVSKLAAMQLCSIYRKAYGMFISSGILFDHTSEVRGEDNLTQRVAVWAAKMMLGSYEDLSVGNLNARRDWGYAKDFVNAMWLMLQQDKPDDFVIGTGEQHTVRELIEMATEAAGAQISWAGSGKEEKGSVMHKGKTVSRVYIDPVLVRPIESENYMADYRKAKNALGWEPTLRLKEIIRLMINTKYYSLSLRKKVSE
ncbi:MAG: GDP-mannose 4,6-dehydratase [Nitrososphaeria archaeon]